MLWVETRWDKKQTFIGATAHQSSRISWLRICNSLNVSFLYYRLRLGTQTWALNPTCSNLSEFMFFSDNSLLSKDFSSWIFWSPSFLFFEEESYERVRDSLLSVRFPDFGPLLSNIFFPEFSLLCFSKNRKKKTGKTGNIQTLELNRGQIIWNAS